MTPFLKQVAAHYFCNSGNSLCLVFPSRRSLSYFRKYYAEIAREKATSPVIAPRMVTIGDFFAACSPSKVAADRITLLVQLYESYRKFNPSAESLDEFIFWGDVILGDFSDVDKYLVDPHQIFSNVSDFKALQDDLTHLTEGQKAQIEKLTRFMDNFKERPVAGGSKDKFLKLWNILEKLYYDFQASLSERGLSYDGMIYRDLATRITAGGASVSDVLEQAFPGIRKYVFVGLNVLNPCEHAVLSKMKDASLAEFCWDFEGDIIRDKDNKSSKFLSRNMKDFPPSVVLEKVSHAPKVSVVSVPSGVGQAKQVPFILSQLPDTSSCAVVLPDETLLMPLLNSIPPQVGDVNVTMGLTMSASEMFALMDEILTLQMHLRIRDGKTSFYHRQVRTIFANAVFKKAFGKEMALPKKYYISQDTFVGDELLEAVFTPVVTDISDASEQMNSDMLKYLKNIISIVAERIAPKEEMSLQVHFAKEYHCSLTSLENQHLAVKPLTMIKLIRAVTCSQSVPFEGRNEAGLQIMGPLETRALDFENIIILSCNEGTFPRHSSSASFIPPLLRADFGLPTYELKDCVWAYYFYRMISRAQNLWMVYDSRTEGLCSGEESRFIKQLRYHFKVPMTLCESSSSPRTPRPILPIEKTSEVMDIISSDEFTLSASSLENYVQCPAKFYYSKIRKLADEDEVLENLDAGTMGTVFHKTMKALYGGLSVPEKMPVYNVRVSADRIRGILSDKELIQSVIEQKICSELNCDEVTGRDLVTAEIIEYYVQNTLKADLEMLRDAGKDAFNILSLEAWHDFKYRDITIKAQLDRVDTFDGKNIRIVDYKTGQDREEVLNSKDVAEKFFKADTSHKVKAAFQFFIYQKALIEHDHVAFGNIDNSLYQITGLVGKTPGVYPSDPEIFAAMQEGLDHLIDEILNPSVPFCRTENKDACNWCDFKTLCGR